MKEAIYAIRMLLTDLLQWAVIVVAPDTEEGRITSRYAAKALKEKEEYLNRQFG